MEVMDDPKAKKKALLRKRNKRNFIIRKMLEDKERENERAQEDEKKKEESLAANYSTPGTLDDEASEKVSEFRLRMTNKKRKSRERWNRFAATSGSGGRGL